MCLSTRFVVQLHGETTLHFDLRIQADEVLRSWAVPKGPSLDPAVRRLAVAEDHELPASEFDGMHDGQRRGSGGVIIILRVLMLQCRRVTGESLERPGSFLA